MLRGLSPNFIKSAVSCASNDLLHRSSMLSSEALHDVSSSPIPSKSHLKSKSRTLLRKHSNYGKKSHSHYYASSPTISGNIHMPSILARQDALVFVDKSKIVMRSKSVKGFEESALFWSPGVVIDEDEQDNFFDAMNVDIRPQVELTKHQVLVCLFEDAS